MVIHTDREVLVGLQSSTYRVRRIFFVPLLLIEHVYEHTSQLCDSLSPRPPDWGCDWLGSLAYTRTLFLCLFGVLADTRQTVVAIRKYELIKDDNSPERNS